MLFDDPSNLDFIRELVAVATTEAALEKSCLMIRQYWGSRVFTMDSEHYYDPIATQRAKEVQDEEVNHKSRIEMRSNSKGILKRALRIKNINNRQSDQNSTSSRMSAQDLGEPTEDVSNNPLPNTLRSKTSTDSITSLSSILSSASSYDASLPTVPSASTLTLPNSPFEQSDQLENGDAFEDAVTEGPPCAWNLMAEASMEVENRTNVVIMNIISSLDNDIITLATGLLSRHLTFEPRNQATIWKANLTKLRDTLSELLEFSWRWRRWYRIVRSSHIQKVSEVR